MSAVLFAGCQATQPRTMFSKQILFVCDHGNVKSLMAMSYFNETAARRGLPFIAVSRGVAIDTAAVPPKIVWQLRADGFDVSTFHPAQVSASDVSASSRVITIGTELPAGARVPSVEVEQWNDVPPASVDYAAAGTSLRAHVETLIDQLAILDLK
jgi:arsenate reductase (thioredoxin)